MIPVLGSAWSAIYNFQHGNYFLGAFNTVLAASDWLLVRAAAGFVAKTIWRAGAKETSEVIFTRISKEAFEEFAENAARNRVSTYVSRTEGAVYGAAIENAPWWRTMLNPSVKQGQHIRWTGDAAELFGKHEAAGWYSGLKRLLGQYKTDIGNVEMLHVVRNGNELIVSSARLTPKSGTGQIIANLRVLGRWVGIDYAALRSPFILDKILQDFLGKDID